MPKKPKPAAPTDAEVVDGELVDADDPVDVEPGEPDATELADEDVPSDDALPAVIDADDDEAPVDDAAAAHALVPEPKSGRSLARLDPLQLYIQDIRRYPLLSREDEHALAKKFVETGDVEAARRLVTANLRLVVKIAHEYRRAHRNLLDLIQEGNIGLMQAVKKYDPYRGVKLSSYAAWWIRAYMLKFILNNWRLVKIGTTQAQRKLFFNLKKEKDKLEQLGFDTSSKALAEALDVPEREVIDMEKRLGHGEMSLDAPRRQGRRRRPLAPRHARVGGRHAARRARRGRRVPRLVARQARGVRQDAARARADHLPGAPAHRRAEDAAGDRRELRHLARARPPAREAA